MAHPLPKITMQNHFSLQNIKSNNSNSSCFVQLEEYDLQLLVLICPRRIKVFSQPFISCPEQLNR